MNRPRQAVLDALVALAFFALGQGEVWLGPDPGFPEAGVAAMATLPLAARRMVPVVVLGVLVLALTALTLQGTDEFTVAQLLGLMLASYTAAALLPLRSALALLGVVVGAALANSAAGGSRDAGDYVFPVILLGVPWAAGASIRRWRERTEELRRLAAELAAERELHARLAVAAERGRIARDLHDSLAQSLNAMVVHAEAAQEALGRGSDGVAQSLSRIQEVGRGSLAETRQLLTGLRENTDGEALGIADLDRLADGARGEGLAVDVSVTGDAERPTAPVQAAVYRIVQEGLTNAVRHSTGRQVRVEVEVADEVRVAVADDGTASREGAGSGLGLVGMRERAQLLGGECRAGFGDTGFLVEARIPAGGPS